MFLQSKTLIKITKSYFGSISIIYLFNSSYFGFYFIKVILSNISFFIVSSAQIIILIIQFKLGIEKCVNPVYFYFFSSKTKDNLLKASIVFQNLLTPFGIGNVSFLSTLRYLQTGLDNSFRYSVVIHGPKLGRSYSFYIIS